MLKTLAFHKIIEHYTIGKLVDCAKSRPSTLKYYLDEHNIQSYLNVLGFDWTYILRIVFETNLYKVHFGQTAN